MSKLIQDILTVEEVDELLSNSLEIEKAGEKEVTPQVEVVEEAVEVKPEKVRIAIGVPEDEHVIFPVAQRIIEVLGMQLREIDHFELVDGNEEANLFFLLSIDQTISDQFIDGGVQTLYPSQNEEVAGLADELHRAFFTHLPEGTFMYDREFKNDSHDFPVVEMGLRFTSHIRDQKLIYSEGYRVMIATTLAKALCETFGVEYNVPKSTLTKVEPYWDVPRTPIEAIPQASLNTNTMGVSVERLQEALDKLGYPTQVNGIYDHKITGRVKKFQDDRNLPVTGVVNQETMHHLDLALAEKQREKLYKVRTAMTMNRAEALNLAIELTEEGYSAYIVPVEDQYQIEIAAFSKKKNAENFADDASNALNELFEVMK